MKKIFALLGGVGLIALAQLSWAISPRKCTGPYAVPSVTATPTTTATPTLTATPTKTATPTPTTSPTATP